MRIIAGTARGTTLEVAKHSSARPFLELARGALFNSLGDRVAEAAVLDLYAGSGALGLEALSRGAASCLFVERDPPAFAALERNIAKCGFAGVGRALRMDVGVALTQTSDRVDLIFMDPPFPDLPEWRAGGLCGGVMRAAADALRPGGLLIFRIEEGKVGPPEWPGLERVAERRYGRSRICRYGKS